MANGVPINSLQDLLLLRELQDQADPFKSGLKALAQGVQSGIETQREEAAAEKARQEDFSQKLKLLEVDSTNRMRIENFKAGNKIVSTKEKPVYKEARGLGISTKGKNEEQIIEEVTQYHRDQNI